MNLLYNGHIPTNSLQKLILTLGSSIISILDPTRDDMVATLGETIGINAARYMQRKMHKNDEGKQILTEKPIINSSTINFNYLASLPQNTLGKSYLDWYNNNNVSPDTRKPVHFIDDPELSYIIRRNRDVHDLLHTVLGMPTNILGEVCVKWVEAIQTGLPMCALSSLFGPLRFNKRQKKLYVDYYLNWAVNCGYNSNFLMAIYFEKYWEESLKSFRKRHNIQEPPLIIK